MPPRHAYWTILVDNAPTAFRSSSKEELLPTFNRLKEKHESAVMKWWQNGKLWDSRLDAQEAMRARGEMGRRGDFRQSDRPSFRDRKPQAASHRPDFKPQAASRRPFGERRPQAASRKPFAKSEWKPRTQDPRPKTQDPFTCRSE